MNIPQTVVFRLAPKGDMSRFSEKHKLIHTSLASVNRQVEQFFKAQDSFLKPWLRNATAMRGKQLRVRLTLLAARCCGRVTVPVERLATALELFHVATLMHDDVIDNAKQRRHALTVNAQHGNVTAVLMGDLLFTQVMSIVFEHLPPKTQRVVLQAAKQVCLGEAEEQYVRGQLKLSVAQYQTIIRRKTASLFSACCQGGAELAGGDSVQIRSLATFGQALGMAFQIQDDILDLIGSPNRVGKTLGSDLKEGRITLPIILALQTLKGQEKKQFSEAVSAGYRKLPTIRKTLQEQGFITEAKAVAHRFTKKAKKALNCFPESKVKQELLALAEYAIDRDR
jgi:octaprenyl-diphosphate synthase